MELVELVESASELLEWELGLEPEWEVLELEWELVVEFPEPEVALEVLESGHWRTPGARR